MINVPVRSSPLSYLFQHPVAATNVACFVVMCFDYGFDDVAMVDVLVSVRMSQLLYYC